MNHLFITAPGGTDGVYEQRRYYGVKGQGRVGEHGLPTEERLREILLDAVEKGIVEYREALAKRANVEETA